mgnify:CR=1 FL=1
MKMFIKKIIFSFIAVITLGMYIPQSVMNPNTDSSNSDTQEKKDSISSKITIDYSPSLHEHVYKAPSIDYQTSKLSSYIDQLIEEAKVQTIKKLGPKISSQIETEFDHYIFPVMEKSIKSVISKLGDEAIFFSITEQPSKGLGERIFHLYDEKNQRDIAKFHVRRDLKPLEGYWFNFHYHLFDDQFEEHYDLGNIYWDKNVPPKWMS